MVVCCNCCDSAKVQNWKGKTVMDNDFYPFEYGTSNFREPDYTLCCVVVFGSITRQFWQCHRPRITGQQNSYCEHHQRKIEAEEKGKKIMDDASTSFS